MNDRTKEASDKLDVLEKQVKTGAIKMHEAMTKAFALGIEFAQETHRRIYGDENRG